MDQTISLRPITAEDVDFLYRVYASTRADEMKLVDWDDAQKRAFLEMQFKGLEDWAIVDLWIKSEEGREIRRTVLYVLTANAWKVGDSGRLAD